MTLCKSLCFFGFVALVSSCTINMPESPLGGYAPVQPNEATGGVDGGGGKSVVCRNDQQQIISAQSLDLYEGRTLYGLHIQTSDESMNLQIEKALKTFAGDQSIIKYYVSIVKEKMTLLPAGTQLSEVSDSYDIVFPKGCKSEQLARYYSDEKIFVNSDIWSLLSQTDKAALILHEAIYKVNRMYGAMDSRQSRHIVMSLFDANTKWIDPEQNVPSDALNCISMNGALFMYAYRNPNNNWVLQFKVLGGTTIVSKKQATLNSNPQNTFDFNEVKSFGVVKGDSIGAYTKISLTAEADFEDGDTIILTKRWEPVVTVDGRYLLGYQTMRYYLTWSSNTFTNLSVPEQMLNCSVKIYK